MASELNQKLKSDLFIFRNLLLIEYKRKIFWSILLYIFFVYAYKFTETHVNFPVTILSPSAIDLLFTFDQRWTPIYLSLFAFLGFGSLTISCKKDFYLFLYLFFGIFLTAISIFYFYPTYIERPQTIKNGFLYGILISEDLPYNLFPSLHASFCITTVFSFFKNSKGLFFKNLYRAIICLWALLIFIAILKVKQHYFIDVIGGILNALIWIWLIYFIKRKNI